MAIALLDFLLIEYYAYGGCYPAISAYWHGCIFGLR